MMALLRKPRYLASTTWMTSLFALLLELVLLGLLAVLDLEALLLLRLRDRDEGGGV